MKFSVKILILSSLAQSLAAQTSPDAAVTAALRNHPSIRAAASDVQAKKYAEKAALNLPNPEVNAESPTGEFYAVGVLQSFDFPTVYRRQKQLAKAETALAQAGRQVSENELRYLVRSVYLEVQVAEFQSRQWQQRDSLYQQIAEAAARQFEGGEIDFLQKTLAENEAGAVHQERLAAERNSASARARLSTLTGLSGLGALLPLRVDSAQVTVDAASASNNPALQFDQQAVRVAEKRISLVKSRALPGFSLGYLNQGPRNTPIDYRFRASISLPLWAGQYRAGRQVAESDAQAARSRAEAQQQALELEAQRARTEAVTALERIRYMEQTALPRGRSLVSAALRLRAAGQLDYVTFLRTLDEAFAIERDYSTRLQAFELARIQLLYLTGR